MKQITRAHREFLFCLLDADVNFIVVSGYAVIYHGYPRLTTDLDVWLKPDNDNKEKLLIALASYSIIEKHIEKVSEFDFAKTQSFHIGEEKNRIDLLTHIAGLSYEEAAPDKEFLEIDEKKIPFIAYNHLIINKMVAGRSQDKADVDILQKVHRKKNNE